VKAALIAAALLAVAWGSLVVATGPLHQSESVWVELLGWAMVICFLAAIAVIVVAVLRGVGRRRGGAPDV
jgi:anti-sigma-K factor RskA